MRVWKHDGMTVNAHVDSDWAQMPVNGTMVKHWSTTQASRALSTAESQYNAVVSGAAGRR